MSAKAHGSALKFGLVALLIVTLVAVLTQVHSTAQTKNETASAALDGYDFVGTMKSVDGSISLDDTLHFRDGHFWSSGCIKCSFSPGAYWTRHIGETIEFRGALESPDRGRFTCFGSVHNGIIKVSINWRRERWYWTVDRDYAFEGRVEKAAVSSISLEQARRRAAGERAPTCTL